MPDNGYLARPPASFGSGPWPAVVVVHEVFGLTNDIKAQADRFAASGYLALAVDLYAGGNTARCLVAALRGVTSGKGGPAMDVIEFARHSLVDREDCTGKVGIIGFCLGGGFAILAAGRYDFDAAAPNYGIVPSRAEVLRGACPIVGSYGKKDLQLRGAAADLEAKLTTLEVDHDVKEYPNSGHGFMSSYTGGWSFVDRLPGMGGPRAEADDAWRRVFAFFETHLRPNQTS